MAKQLKLWNGRGYCCKKPAFISDRDYHVYLAAYSRADAARMIDEYNGYSGRSIASEIKVFFHEGCWGDRMDGIVPERGIWIGSNFGNDVPVKVFPVEVLNAGN